MECDRGGGDGDLDALTSLMHSHETSPVPPRGCSCRRSKTCAADGSFVLESDSFSDYFALGPICGETTCNPITAELLKNV